MLLSSIWPQRGDDPLFGADVYRQAGAVPLLSIEGVWLAKKHRMYSVLNKYSVLLRTSRPAHYILHSIY